VRPAELRMANCIPITQTNARMKNTNAQPFPRLRPEIATQCEQAGCRGTYHMT